MQPEGEAIWERWTGESAVAHELFVLYYRMGARRTLRKLAQETSRNYRTLENLSQKYDWGERVRLWDNEVLAEQIDAQRSLEKEMRERHRSIAKELQETALNWIRNIDPAKIDGQTAVKMMALGVQVEESAMKATLEQLLSQVSTSGAIADSYFAGLISVLQQSRQEAARNAAVSTKDSKLEEAIVIDVSDYRNERSGDNNATQVEEDAEAQAEGGDQLDVAGISRRSRKQGQGLDR